MLTAAALLTLTLHGGAQKPAPARAVTREEIMVATLQAISRDDWRAGEPILQWNLLEAFNTELEQNPGSPMAALVRQAVSRIDLRVAPIIARSADEVNIGIELGPSAMNRRTRHRALR